MSTAISLKIIARELYEEVRQGSAIGRNGDERARPRPACQYLFTRDERRTAAGHAILLSRSLGLVEGLTMELLPEATLLEAVQPVLTKRIGTRSQITWALNQAKQIVSGYLKLPQEVAALRAEIAQHRTMLSRHLTSPGPKRYAVPCYS